MSINTRFFDRRTMDRYVEKGLIEEKKVEAHLKGLPDETNNAQWVQMDLHDAELSEDQAEEGSGAEDTTEEEGA